MGKKVLTLRSIFGNQENIPVPIISFTFAGRLGLVIIAVQIATLTLVRDNRLRMIMSDLINPIVNILASIALFYAARYSSRNGIRSARSWYLWTAAHVLYAIGSILWAVFDLVMHQPPFPSPATVFYALFYGITLIGLTQYSIDENHANVKRLENLDNLIVIIGVGLSFWIFIFRPVIAAHGFNLASIVDLFFPGLGLISAWALMIFFRTRVRQSSYIPLLMIGFGLFSEVTADSMVVNQTLQSNFTSGGWVDLLFVISSISFMLAGIRHVATLDGRFETSRTFNQPAVPPNFSGGWPTYLPYFWLAVAYGLLFASLPAMHETLPLFLIIGLIIGLVILRQVLTLRDNQQLYQKAQEEINVRKEAQESLRQANLVLDARVEQRTKDLQSANNLLVQSHQKIEASLHEKEVLLKEIHHRVKNNLQTISSLLSLQTRLIEDPAARSAFQDSQMRIRSMALIHEKLYQSNSLAEIPLRPYIESLVTILFHSYQTEPGRIELATQVADVSVGIDDAVPIGLILNELISNSLKHAFPDGRTGKIQIELFRESAERIILRCQDNGRGLPGGLDIAKSKSLGLQLVKSLTRQLEGEVEFENLSGLMVWIKIPHHEIESNDENRRETTND
jgi:two-component sensor histidine kinase